MNASAKGRRAEHKARMILVAEGFEVVRAAASKGPADLVAWNATELVLVSVKSGTKYASADERAALRAVPRPANSRVEIWRFPDRCLAPVIERL
jgi:Holliday junction resolvase-like predicted endonuclease